MPLLIERLPEARFEVSQAAGLSAEGRLRPETTSHARRDPSESVGPLPSAKTLRR